MSARRVVVAKGGSSLEREVSMRGALRVQVALRTAGFDVTSIDVDSDFIDRLRAADAGWLFIVMHGVGGEDGTLQDLLEIIHMPYTGSDPLASSICMDKVLLKALMRRHGVPTPAFHTFNERALEGMGASSVFPELIEELHLPLVIKPAAQGSSIGIKSVHERDELVPAMLGAFSYGSTILVERQIEGRELAVTILGPADDPQPLPIVEIHSHSGYFTYEAHYEFGEADFVVPAPLEPSVERHVRETALAAYRLAGCRDFARVDIILDSQDVAQVLEINTIPGLTETGLVPIAAGEAGMSFDDLVARVSARAIAESEALAGRPRLA